MQHHTRKNAQALEMIQEEHAVTCYNGCRSKRQKEEIGKNCLEMDVAASMTKCHNMRGYESWMSRHLRRHAGASEEDMNLSYVVCRSIRDCMLWHWSCNSEKNKEFDCIQTSDVNKLRRLYIGLLRISFYYLKGFVINPKT